MESAWLSANCKGCVPCGTLQEIGENRILSGLATRSVCIFRVLPGCGVVAVVVEDDGG